MSTAKFKEVIEEGYTFKGESLLMGCAMLNGKPVDGLQVRIPLKTMNRHGLIAGATGTGKTKTLQNIAESLSDHSVSVLLMDIKGDLSGLAAEGKPHPKKEERHNHIGEPWQAASYPIEMLTLSDEKGVRMRATVSEFGPVLMSKILDLNDTQGGIMAVIFKYCDDNELPLLDLNDLKKVLQYITNQGKAEITEQYGKISTASTGTILRKIIELETQGAERFFGEKSFEVEDLIGIDENGRGKINVLRLTDIQDKPKLFSTFMLQMMAEIYGSFEEAGDLDAPKLVIFIDEAHLIFDEASEALMDQLEAMVKLIRSKGVGLFFVTQNPSDVPDAVLSQLGLKVQHALRAFTAKDRKAIKLTAENFPLSDFYETDEVLTQLGIGEALVTALNEKGIPTPLAATLMRAPYSRMDILSESEIDAVVNNSDLVAKYNKTIDRESAYEILLDKIEDFKMAERQEELRKEQEKLEKERAKIREREARALEKKRREAHSVPKRRSSRRTADPIDDMFGGGGADLETLARGLMGVLGLGGRSSGRKRSRKKSSGWFW